MMRYRPNCSGIGARPKSALPPEGADFAWGEGLSPGDLGLGWLAGPSAPAPGREFRGATVWAWRGPPGGVASWERAVSTPALPPGWRPFTVSSPAGCDGLASDLPWWGDAPGGRVS